jgi:exonuclease III
VHIDLLLNNTELKILTWNCNGAFRKKFEFISELNTDICIIQECENPNYCRQPAYKKWAENYLWIGDSKSRGLAIFAKPEIELTKLDWSNQYKVHNVKYFLPCKINQDFNLLAVWNHRNNSPNFGYIGQLWKYIQINKDKLNPTIIAGDFNSNSKWDQWDRWWSLLTWSPNCENLELKAFIIYSMVNCRVMKV